MSGVLTPQIIMTKAKCYDLNSIKQVNLWGKQLTDVSAIRSCKNLERATFSQNLISSLRFFEGMTNLKELSLANNLINDLRELSYLNSCPNLTNLWLKDNPISKIPHYRLQVIRLLPGINVLDNTEITAQERQAASNGKFNYDSDNYNNYERQESSPFLNDNKTRYEFNPYNGSSKENNYINNNQRKYVGILPGMWGDNDVYENKYKRPRSRDPEGPGRLLNKYGDIKRGVTPFYNKNTYVDEYLEEEGKIYGKKNKNSEDQSYPNSNRQYSNKNKGNINDVMRVSTSCGQTGILECISTLLKGLSSEELLYIKEHIDKKISKY